MRRRGLGHPLFAIGIAGLGVLSLGSGDFAYIWQPPPSWSAGHTGLAYASGALLLVCGIGLLWPRAVKAAALVLMFYGLASMLLIHAPRLAKDPRTEVEWFNLGEIAAFVAGALLIFWTAAGTAQPARASRWGQRGVQIARLLFALALLAFGLSHFVYAKQTAAMVPALLPAHLFWAYLTGAAHLATGLGILLGVAPRLAATLEALMLSLFALTVNLPDLVRKGGRVQWQWTELFVAAAIAGTAYLVASSYRRSPAT